MDFCLQRLQDDIAAMTQGMSAEMLAQRPSSGKWSAAEILEHLYLTYTGTIRGLEKCLAAGKPLARTPTLPGSCAHALRRRPGAVAGRAQGSSELHAEGNAPGASASRDHSKDRGHGRCDFAGGRKIRQAGTAARSPGTRTAQRPAVAKVSPGARASPYPTVAADSERSYARSPSCRSLPRAISTAGIGARRSHDP